MVNFRIVFRLVPMRLKFLFLSLPFLLYLNTVNGQLTEIPDSLINRWKQFYLMAHGTDHQLISGIKHINLYPTAEGHPFVGEDRFTRGTLLVNGKTYDDVWLKYDINKQKILLRYLHYSGSEEILLLNELAVDEFTLENRVFRRYSWPGTESGFYEVLSDDTLTCLSRLNKELLQGLSSGSFYRFLPENRKLFLVKDQAMYPFRTHGSFVKLFPKGLQREIRHYLRSQEVWFGMAAEAEIKRLMAFCNKLIRDYKP